MVGIPGMNVLSFSLPPHRDLRFRFRSAALSTKKYRVSILELQFNGLTHWNFPRDRC